MESINNNNPNSNPINTDPSLMKYLVDFYEKNHNSKNWEREFYELKDVILSMKLATDILENIWRVSKELLQIYSTSIIERDEHNSNGNVDDHNNFSQTVFRRSFDKLKEELAFWEKKYESLVNFNKGNGNDEKISALLANKNNNNANNNNNNINQHNINNHHHSTPAFNTQLYNINNNHINNGYLYRLYQPTSFYPQYYGQPYRYCSNIPTYGINNNDNNIHQPGSSTSGISREANFVSTSGNENRTPLTSTFTAEKHGAFTAVPRINEPTEKLTTTIEESNHNEDNSHDRNDNIDTTINNNNCDNNVDNSGNNNNGEIYIPLQLCETSIANVSDDSQMCDDHHADQLVLHQNNQSIDLHQNSMIINSNENNNANDELMISRDNAMNNDNDDGSSSGSSSDEEEENTGHNNINVCNNQNEEEGKTLSLRRKIMKALNLTEYDPTHRLRQNRVSNNINNNNNNGDSSTKSSAPIPLPSPILTRSKSIGGAHSSGNNTNCIASTPKSIHNSQQSQKCSSAPVPTESSSSFAANKPLFNCDVPNCKFQTNNRQRLAMHKRSHLGVKLFPCLIPDCGYLSNYKGNIKVHMKHRHKILNFDTDYVRAISEKNKNEDDLMSHNQQLIESIGRGDKRRGRRPKSGPDDEPVFNFEEKEAYYSYLDPMPTSSSNSSPTATNKDEDSSKYKCPQDGCTYKSKWKQCMTAHRLTHAGVKPYKCDFPGCKYRTNFKGNVNVHKRQHRSSVFECDFNGCSFSTPWKNSFLLHRRNHQQHRQNQTKTLNNNKIAKPTIRKNGHNNSDDNSMKTLSPITRSLTNKIIAATISHTNNNNNNNNDDDDEEYSLKSSSNFDFYDAQVVEDYIEEESEEEEIEDGEVEDGEDSIDTLDLGQPTTTTSPFNVDTMINENFLNDSMMDPMMGSAISLQKQQPSQQVPVIVQSQQRQQPKSEHSDDSNMAMN